jgi:hypothetical protein
VLGGLGGGVLGGWEVGKGRHEMGPSIRKHMVVHMPLHICLCTYASAQVRRETTECSRGLGGGGGAPRDVSIHDVTLCTVLVKAFVLHL